MESNHSKAKSHSTDYTVLPSSMSGGPQGLGDPNDRTLRKLENELIYKIMREESRKLCPDEVKVLDECMSTAGGLFFMKCRPASHDLRKCQLKWFKDEDFKAKITEKYLDDRSEFRRTGVTKKQKDFDLKQEREFEDWLKHQNSKDTSVS